jgi:hypothetical protein
MLTLQALSLSASEIEHEITNTITIPCKHTLCNIYLYVIDSDEIVQNFPVGYPLQAAFQSSEPSWAIYRGFNYLHSRVILELQDELRCLEKKLTDTEEMDLENGDGKRLRSRDSDLRQAKREKTDSVRAKLINTIRDKLINYGVSQLH